MNTQFNHPLEITPAARGLFKWPGGECLGNQAVLLKGKQRSLYHAQAQPGAA